MSAVPHGGDLRGFAGKFGLREEEILDFSSNINPLEFPPSVANLYFQLLPELSRYPDPTAQELRLEISRHFPVWPENVIAGNGTMGLLSLAIRTLAPRRALLIEPSFTEYRRLLNLQGTEVRSLLLKEENRFEFSLPQILGALSGVDLLLLGHPNNPTGTALSRAALLELLQEARRRNIFVVIDEAFADWSPEISVAREIKDNTYFLVVRSLTKFFSLAGIRSGFALGSRKFIEKLAACQETWSCNRLAQKLSIAALREGEFRRRSLEWFREESRWMLVALESLGWLKVYPSLANFFLLKVKPPFYAQTLSQDLGQRKIYVRTLLDFAGLDASYLRVALRSRKDNESLLAALHSQPRGLPMRATPGVGSRSGLEESVS